MKPWLAFLLALVLPVAAAERVVTITDYTGRGFAPDLVQYCVPAAGAGKLRLVDKDGAEVPVQISVGENPDTATLSFVTDLAPNGTVSYTLKSDGPGNMATAVQITPEDGSVILANALCAVRLPSPTERDFAQPTPANTIPAPILGFCGKARTWLGSGKMRSTRPVTAFRVKLTASGPVFAEMRYELDFANGGYYHATVQVIDRVPLAKVTEEFDLKELGDRDFWSLNLTQGWTPDMMEVASTAGNGRVDAGKTAPLSELGATPSPISPKWVIIPDSAWGPRSQLGLFNAAEAKASPNDCTLVGFVPLHKGNWRRMNGIYIDSPDSKQVGLRFPMCVRHASWLREVTSETSPFSMQEHDPNLPTTYGRRQWGLVLGKPARECQGEGNAIGPFYQNRLFYGVVGLDRYKDYQLSWPDGHTVYPRVFVKADEVEPLRQAADTMPLGAALKAKWYLLSGSDVIGAQRAKEAKQRLSGLANFMVSSPTIGHHAMAPNYLIAATVEDALAWPKLPAADREDLRARLALVTYLYEEPDVISYADGSHSGNPNMGIARSMGMNNFMALLPDHPQFSRWRAHMAAYTLYKTAIMTAPGGAWFEYGGAYHMHGAARVIEALTALEAAGAPFTDKLAAYQTPDWAYYMNLLTPYDSRWMARMEPGLANSPPSYTEHLLEVAGILAKREPELAANLKWAWQQNGASDRGDPVGGMNGILDRPGLQAKAPALVSQIYPGVGVIFRAHQGTDETYMFLRSGHFWSHWPEDQGHCILMSKGAVLMPYQPYQYWSPKNDFDQGNLIRFGDPTNRLPHSWPDSNVIDHAFGPTVDYAWSSTGFPDWYNTPGAKAEFLPKTDVPVGTGSLRPLAKDFSQTPGAFTWNRQVLFLKGQSAGGPNYFVFRDTTQGDGKLASWFNLNLLGTKASVHVDGQHLTADTEWPVKLELYFTGNTRVQPDYYEENQYLSLGSWSGPSWWKARLAAPEAPISPNWVLKDGSQAKAPTRLYENPGFLERHVFLRFANAPGQEYAWVAYPRGAQEAAPVVTSLAPGVLKVVTSEGTDYAFLSPIPFTFTGEGVTFQGCCGVVRVRNDHSVTLAMTNGMGKVGYNKDVVNGVAPFERTFMPQADAPIAETAPAPRYAISASLPNIAADVTLIQPTDGSHWHIYARAGMVRFLAPTREYVCLAKGNIGVRGMGPFDLIFTDTGITGTVDGDTRTLVTTWPAKVVRPMFHMDGTRYYAGWADDHAIVKDTPTPQFALAFGVTAGKHKVEIAEWTYPEPPTPPARASLVP